jgi:hypothetical protein
MSDNIKIGATVRIKPGLKGHPTISGRGGVVVDLVNDRLLVRVSGNLWMVERSEIRL